jgi:hypothetical protein
MPVENDAGSVGQVGRFGAGDTHVLDLKGTCALYASSGKPLFTPEALDQVGNFFWALGRHAVWGLVPVQRRTHQSEG